MGTAAMYSNGGKVGGKGTGDKVRALLDPREVVLPQDTVKAIGLTTIKALIAATHKHVKTKGPGRIRRMANGGLVGDDPDQPKTPESTYGQQMSNVGGAVASGASRIAKEVFGAPPDANSPTGYGINRLVSGTPAAAPVIASAPSPAAAAMSAPTYNAAADSQTANAPGTSTPIPTVNGASGVTVANAPDVSKFVQGGRTLYTNVAGDNGASAAPLGPISTLNAQAAQNLSDRSSAVARLAAAPVEGGGNITPRTSYEQDTAARNADVKSVFTQGGSRQDLQREQMANSKAIAQLTAQAGLQGHEIAAGAQRYGVDVGAGTAAQKLALESEEAAPRIALGGTQVAAAQRLAGVQQQYLAAVNDPSATPQSKRQAYEALIASQGHVRSLAEKYTVVPQGSQVDPATGLVTHNPSKLFDNQTGREIGLSEPTGGKSQPAASAMPASKDKLVSGTVYQTSRGPAKWNGSQFVPQ